MKKIIAILILAFAIMAVKAPVSFAAGAQKIGYADVGKIFDEYNKTKDLDKILEGKGNKKQAQREDMVKAIRAMKEEAEMLSDKGKEEKQKQIDGKIKELQEFDRVTSDSLRSERDQMAKDILKEVQGVVEEISKQEGYTMIMNERFLLYSDKANSVTDKVLSALNSRYKK